MLYLPNSSMDFHLAPIADRITARAIDALATLLISVFITILPFLFLTFAKVDKLPIAIIIFTLFYSISFIYELGSTRKWGATPGKLLMKLRIINRNGNPVGSRELSLRYAVYLLPYAIIPAGAFGRTICTVCNIYLAAKPPGKAVHDMIARTYVIKISDTSNPSTLPPEEESPA